jgi:phage terminase large subunit-like protein
VTSLVVPDFDGEPWPTLGPQVCELLEDRSVYGPGDLREQPYVVSEEFRGLIYRAYEVFPKGHPRAGRRRFKRVGVSIRKGLAKTELLAQLAFAELHPEAPVRCDGFDAQGRPVGRPVRDPYIPLLAYTEEQSEELAFGALYVIVGASEDADLFDIGLERIMRGDGAGKALALAGAPDSRDGARTTFQGFDETHRLTSPRHRDAHQTMLANIPKRPMADPWSMEITTAFTPGAGSIAESTHAYAKKVAAGEVKDSQLFYFHRAASDEHDIKTDDGLRAAIVEASGPVAAKWSDIEGIAQLFRAPDADVPYLERVWLNRLKQSARQAFDINRWDDLAVEGWKPEPGSAVVLGFDGARWKDATAIVGTELATGRQWVVAVWERPTGPLGDGWAVDTRAVDLVMAATQRRFRVRRVYADPPMYEAVVAEWNARYVGVREWWTSRPLQSARMMRAFRAAQTGGELSHDGDPRYRRHLGNAQRKDLHQLDEDGQPLWVIEKDRPDSDRKIDLAMAGGLSWQAWLDERANPEDEQETGPPDLVFGV